MSESIRRQAEEAIRDIEQAVAESNEAGKEHGAALVARLHDPDAQAQLTQANVRTEAIHRKHMDLLLERTKKILRSVSDQEE